MAHDPELVTINVDGKSTQVPKGVMLVEAAKAVEVDIPVFCYHPKLDPVGMCRMCLVEIGNPGKNKDGTPMLDEQGNPVIQWMPKLMAACTTPATEGVHVRTANTRVADAWRGTLEFLLTSHPLDCPVCDKGGECPLQDLTFAYGPDMSRFYKRNKYHFEKPIPLGDLIWLDRERCIYCARCIRFQEEIAGDPVLKFADRNRGQEIVTFSEPPFDSVFSGNTTDICPVGALTTEDFRFKARVWELTNVPSICNHCPVGCNTALGVRTGDIKRIMPRQNEQVNEMWICDKGRFGHHFTAAPDRLTTPLIRREKGGEFEAASWAEAATFIGNRLTAISATHGADAIGGIAGGKAANEDLYLFVRLLREVIGTNNIDSRTAWPTGTGIEEAVATVGLSKGSNLSELGKGAVVLTIGADLENEQPVTYLRLRKAARRGATVIVAQARPTKEMQDATHPLTVRAGAEAHLAAALLRAVAGSADAALARGNADAAREAVTALDASALAEATGLDESLLATVGEALTGAESLLIMVGREALVNAGANAPALVDALAALLVVTGKAGGTDSGLVALWPHANSQGAADMGALPTHGAGYEALSRPGATIDAMLNGSAGLRAAYLMAADPARDLPFSVETLRALDFLVVQDLFMSETAALADVVLPAAAPAERDGSYTNMERRVQRFQKALEPVGEALADWQILAKVATMAFDADWPEYFTAGDVAAEIAKRVKPYKGFTYDKLRGEAIPWSTTASDHHIFTGTSLPNSWYGETWEAAAEAKKPKFTLGWNDLGGAARPPAGSFRLIPQRVLYDEGTLISRSALLEARRAKPTLRMSPEDAASLGLADGDVIELEGRTVEAVAPVQVEAGIPQGCIVVPLDTHPIFNALGEAAHAPVNVRRAEPSMA